MEIDAELVGRLVAMQFPQWAALPVRPVASSGWDNRIFRLGEHMLVRLPSAPDYAAQVEKEQRWLPALAPLLPLAVPRPLAQGAPTKDFALPWSVYGWIEGEHATPERIADMHEFAASLARFLKALQQIDSADGPLPGPHNLHRGGLLANYDAQTRHAITTLHGRIDTELATEVWEQALATTWPHAPVWTHGDVSAGNLLVRDGRLSAVIDFGNLAIGDPACDLSIAWTLLTSDSRDVFRRELELDDATWARGRAWTMWKAAIVAAGIVETNAVEASQSWRTLEDVLNDHVAFGQAAAQHSSTMVVRPTASPPKPPMNDASKPAPPLPDRLSVDPGSAHHVAAVAEHEIGIRFNDKERFDVEEYCISEGWVKVPAGRAVDRKGKPVLIKLKGKIEPFYR